MNLQCICDLKSVVGAKLKLKSVTEISSISIIQTQWKSIMQLNVALKDGTQATVLVQNGGVESPLYVFLEDFFIVKGDKNATK